MPQVLGHQAQCPTPQLTQALDERGWLWLRDREQSVADWLNLGERLGCNFVAKTAQSPIVGGNSGRKPALGSDSIFTVTGAAADGYGHDVPLHGELYFTSRKPPALLWFYCEQPGEPSTPTLVCDGAALYAELPPAIQQAFKERPIAYHRSHDAQTWPLLYGVQDFEALQRLCAQEGIEAQLQADGGVRTVFRTHAVWPSSAGPVFINNVLPFALRVIRGDTRTQARVRFADGEDIPDDWVLHIDGLVQRMLVPLVWQAGDIGVIDNRRCLHGRGHVGGAGRRVYVRMSSAPQV